MVASDPAPAVARPSLSVIVALVSDTIGPPRTEHLVGCLEAFERQRGAVDVELIVPHVPDVEGLDQVRARFPEVTFVPVPGLRARRRGSREHHDVLRARGLHAARGTVLALVEDHARPRSDYCVAVVSAHGEPGAAIGGAIENGIDRPLNWAVYFCDFGRYQNPVPDGPTPYASDANVSYKREALHDVVDVWRESFREVIVNGALRAGGAEVVLRREIVVYQHRVGLRLGSALRERFIWGRSYAATRNAELSGPARGARALLSPALPAVLVARIGMTAWRRRVRLAPFLRSLHLIALLQIAWSAGECVGYLTGVGHGSVATGEDA